MYPGFDPTRISYIASTLTLAGLGSAIYCILYTLLTERRKEKKQETVSE
jgi:hypothetical protein